MRLEQLDGSRAAEAVDDVGRLRGMLEQEMAVDPIEREVAVRRLHALNVRDRRYG